jgi:hypothetical protein
MLDRVFTNNGLSMRLTYNPDTKRYKGKIINYNIFGNKEDYIYGDSVNEVLEQFYQISNKISEGKE